MRLVVIESPYAGDIDRNLAYLRACMADCLMCGEAPFASHALYTQPGVLRDELPDERRLGIRAGLFWGDRADLRVVYEDLGITRGMQEGIRRADAIGQRIEFRRLRREWAEPPVQPDLFATLATSDALARAVAGV